MPRAAMPRQILNLLWKWKVASTTYMYQPHGEDPSWPLALSLGLVRQSLYIGSLKIPYIGPLETTLEPIDRLITHKTPMDACLKGCSSIFTHLSSLEIPNQHIQAAMVNIAPRRTVVQLVKACVTAFQGIKHWSRKEWYRILWSTTLLEQRSKNGTEYVEVQLC